MKLLIAIPSKGRSKTIFKHTMRWVSRTGFDVRVFVEPQEYETYKAAGDNANYDEYLDISPEQFVDIGQNDKGLSYCMGFIRDYALQHKYDLVFKMDDDVRRFRWRGKNKPDQEMIIDFCATVGLCRKAFGRYPELGAVGFPYGHELRAETQKMWAGINMRLQSCYIIKPEFITEGYNNFQDFTDYLNIRRQNKITLRYGLMGIGSVDTATNKGGLQASDRLELAKVDADKMKELYPGVKFRRVDKPWGIEPDFKNDAWYGIKKL